LLVHIGARPILIFDEVRDGPHGGVHAFDQRLGRLRLPVHLRWCDHGNRRRIGFAEDVAIDFRVVRSRVAIPQVDDRAIPLAGFDTQLIPCAHGGA
jgi:hypothetical protein